MVPKVCGSPTESPRLSDGMTGCLRSFEQCSKALLVDDCRGFYYSRYWGL